ncbi:MAG: class IV adenylate cyclase [Candidatus Pacearchaeota archaeon]
MIEVEAKVAISNPETIRKKARQLGKFSGKKTKIDDYYTLENLQKYPKKSLRIRKMDGYYVINFKQSLGYKKGVHAKKEVEFKVSDISNFLRLIEDFGFKKWLTKEKESEIYKISKNFQIELNKVKGLGWFVEVEYLANPGELKSARKKVNEVMAKLGFKRKDAIKAGYTKQLWQKCHS